MGLATGPDASALHGPAGSSQGFMHIRDSQFVSPQRSLTLVSWEQEGLKTQDFQTRREYERLRRDMCRGRCSGRGRLRKARARAGSGRAARLRPTAAAATASSARAPPAQRCWTCCPLRPMPAPWILGAPTAAKAVASSLSPLSRTGRIGNASPAASKVILEAFLKCCLDRPSSRAVMVPATVIPPMGCIIACPVT